MCVCVEGEGEGDKGKSRNGINIRNEHCQRKSLLLPSSRLTIDVLRSLSSSSPCCFEMKDYCTSTSGSPPSTSDSNRSQ